MSADLAPEAQKLLAQLPEKRRNFVLNLANGMPQGKAAEAAGYSSPAVEASRLMRMPVVLEAIQAMQAPPVAMALASRDSMLTRLARTAHKHHLCGDAALEAIGLKADALSARLQGFDIQRVQVEQTQLKISMTMPKPEGYGDE